MKEAVTLRSLGKLSYRVIFCEHMWILLILIMVFLPNYIYAATYVGHAGDDDCFVCHDFTDGEYNELGFNLRWIKTVINNKPVKFTTYSMDSPYDGTLADGDDTKLDGVCEVCHTSTDTDYHTNTGDGKVHYDGKDCTECHFHWDEDGWFSAAMIGPLSHATHLTDLKGPVVGDTNCTYCHNADDYYFKSGTDTNQDGNYDLSETDVCDSCHGGASGIPQQYGEYDGVGTLIVNSNTVAYGAKYNWHWEDGVYEETIPGKPTLKSGKENWCAGCHDNGTSTVNGVDAPNVMGDGTSYGYNRTGHGSFEGNYQKCEYCHDLAVLHCDTNQRTYGASSNNYRAGYRLNDDMDIPRSGTYGIGAFELCFNCHIYAEVVGPNSSFRADKIPPVYLHEKHVGQQYSTDICWNSDWDENESADSSASCTACHNVHGSPSPRMTRHGELMSPPGKNWEPALDFHWDDSDGYITDVFQDSRWGSLICGSTSPGGISFNHVCWGCHSVGEIKYYRLPGEMRQVRIEDVWTTTGQDVPDNVFKVGDYIRYHVKFTVAGPLSYYVTIFGKAVNTAGASWKQTMKKKQYLTLATYQRKWQRKISSTATPDSTAKITFWVKMYDTEGGTLLSSHKMSHNFSIIP